MNLLKYIKNKKESREEILKKIAKSLKENDSIYLYITYMSCLFSNSITNPYENLKLEPYQKELLKKLIKTRR